MTVTFDADRVCSRCERPRDDLIDRAHGERICTDCRIREAQNYETDTGQCHKGCGISLAYHPLPRTMLDACPTENEARAMAGDR